MAHEETVYDALDHAHGGEGQWAFGTGFDDPLAGVDTAVPDGGPAADAVALVRRRYRPRAVETRRQARFVAGFGP